jgi:hypothetical protein
MRMSSERTINNPAPDPGDSGTYTLRIRRRGGVSYMQMADWGTWDRCWLRFTNRGLSEQVGVDLPASPDLPVGVAVPLNSTVSGLSAAWFGAPYVEYEAQVTALEALEFLGVSARNVLPSQEVLSRAKAPIVVSIGTGRTPIGAAARGSDVAEALRAAGVDLDPTLLQRVPQMSASVEFEAPGAPAEVPVPAPRLVLPDNATKNDTCPANR